MTSQHDHDVHWQAAPGAARQAGASRGCTSPFMVLLASTSRWCRRGSDTRRSPRRRSSRCAPMWTASTGSDWPANRQNRGTDLWDRDRRPITTGHQRHAARRPTQHDPTRASGRCCPLRSLSSLALALTGCWGWEPGPRVLMLHNRSDQRVNVYQLSRDGADSLLAGPIEPGTEEVFFVLPRGRECSQASIFILRDEQGRELVCQRRSKVDPLATVED